MWWQINKYTATIQGQILILVLYFQGFTPLQPTSVVPKPSRPASFQKAIILFVIRLRNCSLLLLVLFLLPSIFPWLVPNESRDRGENLGPDWPVLVHQSDSVLFLPSLQTFLYQIPPETSVAPPPQFPQPFIIWEMIQPVNHLHDLSVASFQWRHSTSGVASPLMRKGLGFLPSACWQHSS